MTRKTLPECGGLILDYTDSDSDATQLKVFLTITGRKTELREVFEWDECVWLDSAPEGTVTVQVNEATSAANVGTASGSATVTKGEWTTVTLTGAADTPTDPTSTRLNIGNCYARPGEAEAYFANRPETTAWDNASSANREKALVKATLQIDSAHRYLGTRLDGSFQVLAFPRLLPKGKVGRTNTRFVPREVREAVFEQALYVLDRGVFQDRQQLQHDGVSSFNVGGVSESFRTREGKAGLCYLAEVKLRPWVARSARIRGGYDELTPRNDAPTGDTG